jgi:hypothetical protein
MGRCARFAVVRLVGVVALAAISPAPLLCAQDGKEKEWKPPEGWKKVVAAQFADIESLVAYDGYLCWGEGRLFPETAQSRAPSFDRRLYRVRLTGERGAKEGKEAAEKPVRKPEQIYRQVSTGSVEPLIGPRGAVVTRFDYPYQTLLLPGQLPLELPAIEGYHPKEFTPDGLLCHAQRYHGSGGYYDSSLALIPIAEGKARADAPQVLLPWVKGEFTADGFHRWGTFRRGDYLVYGLPGSSTFGKSGKGKERPGKLRITVWNEKTKSKAWDAEGVPLAADDRFVYARAEESDAVLIRRSLAGEGEASRLTVPELAVILSLRPPRLFGLFRQEAEWIACLVDLDTGVRSEFDLRMPGNTNHLVGGNHAQNRTLYLRDEGAYRPFLSVAWDAVAGAVYAARGKSIYEVPVVAKRRLGGRATWEAVQ